MVGPASGQGCKGGTRWPLNMTAFPTEAVALSLANGLKVNTETVSVLIRLEPRRQLGLYPLPLQCQGLLGLNWTKVRRARAHRTDGERYFPNFFCPLSYACLWKLLPFLKGAVGDEGIEFWRRTCFSLSGGKQGRETRWISNLWCDWTSLVNPSWTVLLRSVNESKFRIRKY